VSSGDRCPRPLWNVTPAATTSSSPSSSTARGRLSSRSPSEFHTLEGSPAPASPIIDPRCPVITGRERNRPILVIDLVHPSPPHHRSAPPESPPGPPNAHRPSRYLPCSSSATSSGGTTLAPGRWMKATMTSPTRTTHTRSPHRPASTRARTTDPPVPPHPSRFPVPPDAGDEGGTGPPAPPDGRPRKRPAGTMPMSQGGLRSLGESGSTTFNSILVSIGRRWKQTPLDPPPPRNGPSSKEMIARPRRPPPIPAVSLPSRSGEKQHRARRQNPREQEGLPGSSDTSMSGRQRTNVFTFRDL